MKFKYFMKLKKNHFPAFYRRLPPFLKNYKNILSEPIALHPRVVTTPIIDNIVYDTFEYRKTDDGGRGMVNWDLHYRRFPRREEDSLKLEEPIPTPVMVRARKVCTSINLFNENVRRSAQPSQSTGRTFGILARMTTD